jgi:hypothetical protein
VNIVKSSDTLCSVSIHVQIEDRRRCLLKYTTVTVTSRIQSNETRKSENINRPPPSHSECLILLFLYLKLQPHPGQREVKGRHPDSSISAIVDGCRAGVLELAAFLQSQGPL